MKFIYDPRYNIAYIRLHEKTAQVEPLKISDELVVDLGDDGTVYGFELLNANEQLLQEDMGKLLIVNEATGMETEFVLADEVPGGD